jgi:hypothetical protein
MSARNAKTWAQAVRGKATVEAKIDHLAQAIAYLAAAVEDIESEIGNIKRLLRSR